MKNKLYMIAALVLWVACGPSAMAQKFLWDVDFKLDVDNKEWNDTRQDKTNTDMAVFLEPKVGLGFGKGHSVWLGGTFGRWLGKMTKEKYMAEALCFYQYDAHDVFVNAGIFPAGNRKGLYYPGLNDRAMMFDQVAEGALVRWSPKKSILEVYMDWTSMFEPKVRETFNLTSYGKYEHPAFPWVNIAYTYSMRHFGHSGRLEGVTDNIWIYPHIGLSAAEATPLARLDLKLGWVNTFQNDRHTKEGYKCPGGFQMELGIEWKGLGLHDLFYYGEGLMPLYDVVSPDGETYGNRLYINNPFYSAPNGLYNRLEIYYHYQLNRMLQLEVSSVHHCDGPKWYWQQFLTIHVSLDQDLFKKGKKAAKHD